MNETNAHVLNSTRQNYEIKITNKNNQ